MYHYYYPTSKTQRQNSFSKALKKLTMVATHSIITASWVTALLFFKIWFTLLKQSLGGAGGRLVGPEDTGKGFKCRPGDVEQANTESDEQTPIFTAGYRWNRILINDLENIPIALIVFWASVIVSGKEWNQYITTISMGLFMFFRSTHTISYANSLQPYRSLSYLFSKICTAVAAVNLVVSVLTVHLVY